MNNKAWERNGWFYTHGMPVCQFSDSTSQNSNFLFIQTQVLWDSRTLMTDSSPNQNLWTDVTAILCHTCINVQYASHIYGVQVAGRSEHAGCQILAVPVGDFRSNSSCSLLYCRIISPKTLSHMQIIIKAMHVRGSSESITFQQWSLR